MNRITFALLAWDTPPAATGQTPSLLDPNFWVDKAAQWGLLGAVLIFIGFMVYKHTPSIVAAFKTLADGVASMATSIEGLHETQKDFVSSAGADREETREQRVQFREQIGEVHRDVRDMHERVKRIEVNTLKGGS